MSGREIRSEIERLFKTKLDYHQTKSWVTGESSPYGRVYRLPKEPTPDLAYLIGANLGDTSRAKSSWHHNYTIRLRVRDEVFAREFSRAATATLSAKPFKVFFDKKRGLWQTDVNSMLLYRLLAKPLKRLRPYVEHCIKCTAAFLRAFFDAEGSSAGGYVSCSNTNKNVMSYIKRLLESTFSLSVSRLVKSGKAPGNQVQIKGKWYMVNKQCYKLSIGRRDSMRFIRLIGFTIQRKQDGISSS
jgi:DNA endonuclease